MPALTWRQLRSDGKQAPSFSFRFSDKQAGAREDVKSAAESGDQTPTRCKVIYVLHCGPEGALPEIIFEPKPGTLHILLSCSRRAIWGSQFL